MAAWATEITADGSPTLRRTGDGLRMHSAGGAWTQACLRYAAGVLIPQATRRARTFRLLDVGTGSGLNLAAAMAWAAGQGLELEATCLELDPSGLASTSEWARLGRVPPAHGPQLPDWASWHGQALAALGGQSVAFSGPGACRAKLYWGDARDILPQVEAAFLFDGVFLDPFAPSQAPALWEPEFIRVVASLMAPGARLATYSSSLAVRCSLRAAGLEVGRGPRVGGKSDGTLACQGPPVPPWEVLPSRVRAKLDRRLARKFEGRYRAP